jgi:hypothetical protein
MPMTSDDADDGFQALEASHVADGSCMLSDHYRSIIIAGLSSKASA